MKKIISNIPIFDYLNEIISSYQNYYAIHFYTSKLNTRNQNDFQLKIASNILEDLLINSNNRIFHVSNNDIIIIVESTSRTLIEKLIYQLRYLFIDDPIAFKKNKVPNPDFCKVFVLAFHYHEFVERYNTKDCFLSNQKEGNNCTLSDLSNSFIKIEQDLKNLKISNFIRRQNITLINYDTKTRLFNEIYVNFLALKTSLKYENNFLQNRNLFKFLLENIDLLFVEEIANNPSAFFNQPINLNFTIETILSENFTKIINSISSFLANYHYAINILKELGYKICLDGVDAYSINYLNRNLLDADLVKLRWDDNINNIIDANLLKKQILKWNPNRVIFTHCDNIDAINYGNKLGIVLFQGLYIEKIATT